eukprot:TRINITY_DN2336_c0_g1_i1.p2 TRINITY_DN2336_c0_g1~~TRINITY_DN2336_c0_g1_i1.p2  ORF type:complete len:139 (+),score=17.51 TRINITY_DN2336_c0_g1_i1:337-753(+)
MDSSTGLDSSESELLLDISKIIFFVLCPISVLSSFFIIATYIIFRKEFSKILGSDFVLFLSICDFFLAGRKLTVLRYMLFTRIRLSFFCDCNNILESNDFNSPCAIVFQPKATVLHFKSTFLETCKREMALSRLCLGV